MVTTEQSHEPVSEASTGPALRSHLHVYHVSRYGHVYHVYHVSCVTCAHLLWSPVLVTDQAECPDTGGQESVPQ